MGGNWIDLLDPPRADLVAALPPSVHPRALDQMLARGRGVRAGRPTLERHGDYIFGVFLAAVAVREEDVIYYQEVDFVLTRESIVTVRKTPPRGAPLRLQPGAPGEAPAYVAYRVVDAVAETFLSTVTELDAEIGELEDHVEDWPDTRVRVRISSLRHDLLRVRQMIVPTRDAVRRVFDGRFDLEGEELFDRDLELSFADAHDKLVRAYEDVELARDLVAGVRDYHLAQVANAQNDVMKRLAAIASLLLLPTFIVGLYGQNFDHMPELHWRLGYAWSWLLIVLSTIGQLWFFRSKRWL